MSTLSPFSAEGTARGREADIEVRVWPAWPKFGHGRFSQFDSYTASFSGEVEIPLLYKGRVDVSIDLLDRNAKANIGPCAVTINGAADHNATYEVQESKLVFTASMEGKSQKMIMYRTGPDSACTVLEVEGSKKGTFRVRPGN